MTSMMLWITQGLFGLYQDFLVNEEKLKYLTKVEKRILVKDHYQIS